MPTSNIEKWKLADVMHHCEAGKTTVYRWMQKHPTMTSPKPNSLAGTAFPQPIGKDGRVVYWDADAVRAWWAANRETVGRESKNAVIVIPWESFRASMTKTESEPADNEETGQSAVESDDNRLWYRVERHGEEARIWFHEVEDAVLYKLKWY